MAKIPYLYYTEEFSQLFLRSTQDFSKVIGNMPKANSSEILDRYQTTFKELALKEDSNTEYIVAITTTIGQMRKNTAFCKSYVEQAVILSQARKFLNDNKGRLHPFYPPSSPAHSGLAPVRELLLVGVRGRQGDSARVRQPHQHRTSRPGHADCKRRFLMSL